MKRIILFFAVCLGLSVFQTTLDANAETARTTAKRTSTTSLSTNINSGRSIASDSKRSDTTKSKNTRTATKNTQKIVTRTPVNQNVKPRTTVTQPTKNVTQRSTTKTLPQNRTVNTRKTSTSSRAATVLKTRKKTELDTQKIESIKSADYSNCKTVYYECMDEFCANKDANLRRCACSSRIHEFDNIKKQLDEAEDKMLDFNQRLLTVSLDKEDAAAINVATEGETAFYTKDRSKSEKLLQKITKNLNSSADSKINNDLTSISLSLDLDTAWDDIDSLSGIATTSKTGLDLYNAARPICVEMAKEVCSDEELTIAQDGYKLTIQQDCNTVAKSYETLYNNTMEKIHESSALLDMSRLNAYQQRNSDDTLTCKKKILTQLSSASVCGEDLYKCLDTTGEYIDPSTGKAFLSENLYELSNLLQEPVGREKWSDIAQNEKFVTFLKAKKKFLEPAIEQCQDIADTIWKEFLDDALSQIKLAQKAKLEEVKRSCTALVTECKASAHNDLSELDSRALSVFSVAADKTANEMCRDVQNSCTALMNTDIGNTWSEGMADIATDITYDTVIETCSQIGRDCIVQKCNGSAGNFALCTNIKSDNRMAILKRDVCWQDVYDCVLGTDNLTNMKNLPIIKKYVDYYNSLYTQSTPYYQCTEEDGPDCQNVLPPKLCDDENDIACLITEQIWGNCESEPDSNTPISTYSNIPNISTLSSNKILIPNTGSTLLSWFATNTSTTNSAASCSAYGCPINYIKEETGVCQLLTQSGTYNQNINVGNNLNNFCESGIRDTFGNCCSDGYISNGICVPTETTNGRYNALYLMTAMCNTNVCNGLSTTSQEYAQCQNDISYYCPNPARQISIYCITPRNNITTNQETEAYECMDGDWILIDQYGNYFNFETSNTYFMPIMSYIPQPDEEPEQTCTYEYDNNNWTWQGSNCNDEFEFNSLPTNNEFTIKYQLL